MRLDKHRHSESILWGVAPSCDPENINYSNWSWPLHFLFSLNITLQVLSDWDGSVIVSYYIYKSKQVKIQNIYFKKSIKEKKIVDSIKRISAVSYWVAALVSLLFVFANI